MGESGRARFFEHFTIDRVATQMIEFYERALALATGWRGGRTLNATYLVRFDDLCPTMRWSVWEPVEQILDAEGIRPIVAVIPDNADPSMRIEPEKADFWERVRTWQAKGWAIGLTRPPSSVHEFGSWLVRLEREERIRGSRPAGAGSEPSGRPRDLRSRAGQAGHLGRAEPCLRCHHRGAPRGARPADHQRRARPASLSGRSRAAVGALSTVGFPPTSHRDVDGVLAPERLGTGRRRPILSRRPFLPRLDRRPLGDRPSLRPAETLGSGPRIARRTASPSSPEPNLPKGLERRGVDMGRPPGSSGVGHEPRRSLVRTP